VRFPYRTFVATPDVRYGNRTYNYNTETDVYFAGTSSMRVSLINGNLIGQDATGQTLLHQLRFHRRRGDAVAIYVEHKPEGIPADAMSAVRVVDPVDLMAGRDGHFAESDLYVYHYPGRYDLLDTLTGLDRGAVVFYYHNVTPPALWGSATGVDELTAGLAAVRHYAPYADLTVTPSPFNAAELVNEHGCAADRVRVLPLPVPLDTFHPGPEDLELVKRWQLAGKRVILFVGRVAGNKRVDLLVTALAQVRQTVPNVVLLIVGDYTSNPAFADVIAGIRRTAADLDVADRVIFTGRVTDLAPYYRLADVYASASLHEGFGVPLIEAMASGTPVVAADAGAQPWVMGEAGLLAPAGDAAALAAHLTGVLTDDMLRGDLVRRGLARSQGFSLEAYYAGWAAIVDEIAEWLAAPTGHPPGPPRVLPGPPAQGASGSHDLSALPPEVALAHEIDQLQKAAKSVIQSYTVRSGAPLVGPLIAWARRNLTSHLREPYLDPTLRRQERFNWLVVTALRQIARSWPTDTSSRLAALEARLDATLDLIATQLAQIEALPPGPERDAALADLRGQVEALRAPGPSAAGEQP
jgi:glycosyltransferase involved in cell wall biosynthesis